MKYKRIIHRNKHPRHPHRQMDINKFLIARNNINTLMLNAWDSLSESVKLRYRYMIASKEEKVRMRVFGYKPYK
jgi:hypothetical protein